jgi:hypothetical protein
MTHLKRVLKIAAICLAVGALLLVRRPPKAGDAAISGVEKELLQRVSTRQGVKSEVLAERPSIPKEKFVARAEDVSAVVPVLQSQPVEETAAAETLQASVTAERQVGAQTPGMGTPVGVVDARNCIGLNYSQIMRGAVSTRMVWNGHTFVPQKVCVVKEGNSVASVWSFEQSSGAIVSEIRDGLKAPSDPAEK